MGRVKAGSSRMREAGELLELSYRQAKRIWARYGREGPKLYSMATAGKGPTELIRKSFAKRYCARCEIAMAISGRRWPPNIWPKKKDSRCMRRRCGVGWGRRGCGEDGGGPSAGRRRERKAHFGELVQLDGSFHEWLEERGRRGCLMHMVNSTTSTVSCQFSRKRRSGRRWVFCECGSSATGFRAPCTPTGRMCMCERRRKPKSARVKCQ